MSEHKYLTAEEIAEIRDYSISDSTDAEKSWWAKQGARLLADLEAIRAERDGLQDRLHANDTALAYERQLRRDERAEIDRLREENQKNLELWDADAADKDAEIARLREENAHLSDKLGALVFDPNPEIDRLRKALEELAKDGCVMGWNDGRTCMENNDTCFGICTGCIASRALKPQPTEKSNGR